MPIGGPIRVSGFSSGMDIDKLVSDLMRAERLPLDKLHRQKQSIVWQREEYRSANTTLLSLRNSVSNIRMEGEFTKAKVTSSNTNIADVLSNKPTATSAVVDVKSLATGAVAVSGSVDSAIKEVSITGAITVEGSKGKVNINVTSGTSTVKSIIDEINTKSAATGVKAHFDENTKRVMFSSTDMGSNAKVSITNASISTDPTAPVPDVLKNVFKLDAAAIGKGTDATYTINGSADITSTTNTVDINGTKVALKGTGTVTFGTNVDQAGVKKQITEFVAKYNELVDKFSEATTTRPNRGYQPLTDSEREAMSDKQIEQWEKKARQGILYSDDFIESTLTSLRTAINTPLKGVGEGHITLLSEIGIKPSSDYKMNGKLEINEEKLDEALNTKFDEVVALFTKSSDTKGDSAANAAQRRSEQGFAERIYEEANKRIDGINKRIGSSTVSMESMDESVMGKELRALMTKESQIKSRLLDIENRYYKKFTAMEKALQELNNKGSWLSQQIGAM